MKSTDLLIAGAAAAGIVTVVVLSIFVFSGQVFSAQKLVDEKTNAGTEAEIIVEDTPALFFEEAYADQSSVVLRIIPTEDVSRDYYLSYRIEKGCGEEYRREENLTGISADNPITVSISRMADEWVDIFAEVRDQDGLLVWESQSGYG